MKDSESIWKIAPNATTMPLEFFNKLLIQQNLIVCNDTDVFISGLMQHAQYVLPSHDDGSTSQDLVLINLEFTRYNFKINILVPKTSGMSPLSSK